ncbi:hypothetical protein [Nocardia sp. AG03]|uniref:hypothetical protein n=1 Tax=Nocardia sp. AG03 TaxID=3025312 RepID=UPI0024189FBC|nr:hypothetical protein [Nocardia sp. AG03]
MFKATMAAVAITVLGVLGSAGTAHAETYGPYWYEDDCYDALNLVQAEFEEWDEWDDLAQGGNREYGGDFTTEGEAPSAIWEDEPNGFQGYCYLEEDGLWYFDY